MAEDNFLMLHKWILFNVATFSQWFATQPQQSHHLRFLLYFSCMTQEENNQNCSSSKFWNLHCLHNGLCKKILQEKNGVFQTFSCLSDVINSLWKLIELEGLVNVRPAHSALTESRASSATNWSWENLVKCMYFYYCLSAISANKWFNQRDPI